MIKNIFPVLIENRSEELSNILKHNGTWIDFLFSTVYRLFVDV